MRLSAVGRAGISHSPLRLGIVVSALTSVAVNVLGFWDLEDMLTYFYSTGARFGGVFNTDGISQPLVYRVMGVPLLDFGIIGGYRLPYQGVINTGPLWVFSGVISAQLIVFITHLMAMVVSGAAFGHFWKQIQPSTNAPSLGSRLFFVATLTAANFPTLEYVLDQDWYSNSLAYQGFFITASGLLSLAVLIQNDGSKSPDANTSLRFAIVGTYVLLMGLWSYLPLYVPPLLVLACFAIFSAYRRRVTRTVLFAFFRSPLNVLMFLTVLMSLGFVLVDVSIELSSRSLIDASGVDYWWARPSRSLSDLQHFFKQILTTEVHPWSEMINSLFGERFGLPKDLTRIPHSALIVMSLIAIRLLRGRGPRNRSVVVILSLVWSVSFLQMIHVLPNPLRIRSDSFFRDILLSFAMFAASLVYAGQKADRSFSSGGARRISLPVLVLLTSFAVAISYPLQHLAKWRQPSPYGLIGMMGEDQLWSKELHDAFGVNSGVMAVVDPVFLNRWTDFLSNRQARELAGESLEGLVLENWKGLYGSFQVRQAGFIVLEGQPKIRDATAFTGLNNSLKQSLEAPSVEYCEAQLFAFLGVTHVVAMPDILRQCVSLLESSGEPKIDTTAISEVAELSDSGMSFVSITSQTVYESTSSSLDDFDSTRCGLLADPKCFTSLQLRPSAKWELSAQQCRLPCLRRLSRQDLGASADAVLLLPINAEIPMHVSDETGRRLSTAQINGLLAIPTAEVEGQQIVVAARADWRMWLQVAVAYGQYIVIGVVLTSVWRRRSKRHESVLMGKHQ